MKIEYFKTTNKTIFSLSNVFTFMLTSWYSSVPFMALGQTDISSNNDSM